MNSNDSEKETKEDVETKVNNNTASDLKKINKNSDDNNMKTTTKSAKLRSRLPAKMIDRSQISIWSILKQSIGKELSKIAMPASLCEPLSFLQRITENVTYCDLLNKAADPLLAPNHLKRFEYLCGFAVSNISFNHHRLCKPFNPLLCETYELTREELGFKIVAEQVSHHPPITAFHSEALDPSRAWKFYGNVNAKVKFWGKSVEIKPVGTMSVELNKFNETFTWQAVTCCVHNIVVGKLWFEYYGTMEIRCAQTGYRGVINFKPYSWSNKELCKVDGYIYDNKKTKVKALYGYWTHRLYTMDVDKYEHHIKHNIPLPMSTVDEFFNELTNPLKKNFHSDSNFQQQQSTTTNSSSTNSSPKSEKHPTFTLNSSNEKENKEKNGKFFAASTSTSIKRGDSMQQVSKSQGQQTQNQESDATEIWRVLPLPNYTNDYYNFNYFTMCLNEFKDEQKSLPIAPTDSRYRVDVRQLELGNLDEASEEKNRLEVKQREVRKSKTEPKAKWFAQGKHSTTKEEMWLSNNKYWNRNYSECPDLYG